MLDKALEILDSKDLNINYNGHFPIRVEYLRKELLFRFIEILQKGLEENFENFIETGKLSKPIEFAFFANCQYCDEIVQFSFDGSNLNTLSDCKYRGGIKEVTVELNVPSGKMVFANDLREYFQVQGSFNINSQIGLMQTMKAYEKIGMIHGFVGNTCPHIYQRSQKTLSISDTPIEDFWDPAKNKYVSKTKAQIKNETPKGKVVGGICTDLWWYCIVDYEDLKTRYLATGGNSKTFNKYLKNKCSVVDVKPGVYSIQHLLGDVDASKAKHYAHIKWNRKPEKRNLSEEYQKINYTIGQCFLVACRNYPTLHGFGRNDLPKHLNELAKELLLLPVERLEKAYQLFLDQTFCVTGNGCDWHENGWGSGETMPEDVPDFPLPKLTKQHNFYPISREYADLCLAAFNEKSIRGKNINLNESFLAGAYEVLYCILKFGAAINGNFTRPEINREAYEKEVLIHTQRLKEQTQIAQDCLNGLSKRYPGSIPKHCEEFISK